jgi:hypothetical protein
LLLVACSHTPDSSKPSAHHEALQC